MATDNLEGCQKEESRCWSLDHPLQGWHIRENSQMLKSSEQFVLVASEYEATQVDMHLADSIDHKLVEKVFKKRAR